MRKSFLAKFSQPRKIQVHLVTIFLFLLAASSLSIILFTHIRLHKEIVLLASNNIRETSKRMVDKLDRISTRTEYLAKITDALITTPQQISKKNEPLMSYLINSLKYDPLIYRINIGTPQGSMISVTDLSFIRQESFISMPKSKLPPGVKFVVRVIDRSNPTPYEIIEYRGTDNNILATETLPPQTDPRDEYWYKNIIDWPRLYWSKVPEMLMEEKSITLSQPVFDEQHNVIAIIGINYSLSWLSNYISHQQIGIHGKVFVFDSEGKILLPISYSKTPSEELAKEAYKQFIKNQKNIIFLKKDNVKYLIYVSDFPLSYETKWHVTIVVPFEDFFGDIHRIERLTILISLAILIVFGFFIYLASKFISTPIIKLTNEVNKIRQFDFSEVPVIKSHIKEIITLDISIKAMRAALHSFGKYIPKEIVKALIKQGREISLGGEKKNVTIMFSDIENFTTLSEALPLEQLMSNLADYFDIHSKIILDCQGTIDKYIGDGIMAFWGAPLAIENQADLTCLACLRCSKSRELLKNKDPFIEWHSRFGIHSGEVIVGNIGTKERMNYTIIGDAVNAASRLQDINKEYRTSIIISESVKEKIHPRFLTRPLDCVAVKGKKQKLEIFELVGIVEGEEKDFLATLEQKNLCEMFTKAYTLLKQGQNSEAKALFSAIHQKFPSDWPTELYLKRLK